MRKPGAYPARECRQCGASLVPRLRANGIRETPREFQRRQRCDVCSPPLAKPRHIQQASVLQCHQTAANRLLRQWRNG